MINISTPPLKIFFQGGADNEAEKPSHENGDGRYAYPVLTSAATPLRFLLEVLDEGLASSLAWSLLTTAVPMCAIAQDRQDSEHTHTDPCYHARRNICGVFDTCR